VLVEEWLAARVNIVPGLRSVLPREGAVRIEQECLMLAKTRADRYPDLEVAIRARHPDELPEILSVRIDSGLAGYPGWIGQSVS
jgi:periplasmic divalent cation tolerance protein